MQGWSLRINVFHAQSGGKDSMNVMVAAGKALGETWQYLW